MLIVFEGVHSAGKSTQVALLVDWLMARGVQTIRTSWNSSPPLGAMITELKIRNELGPQAMVLMEAADLAYRYETVLRRALDSGYVAVSDRYYYSTMARGSIRGVALDYIRECFRFAPEPELVFHVRCTGQETLRRRVAARQSLGSHLSGADFRPVLDERSAFATQQDEIDSLYEELLPADAIPLSCLASREELHETVIRACQTLESAL